LTSFDVLNAGQYPIAQFSKLRLRVSGKLHAKDRAGTIVLDPDAPSVRLDRHAAEAKAEPAAVTVATARFAFEARILLENLLAQLLGDTVPPVADGESEPARRARRLDVDRAALGSVLDAVVDEVLEHASHEL